MKKVIKQILHKITSKGFEAYIIGGYVRDTILGIESFDIDICTSALPKDIVSIFDGYDLTATDYGNIKISNNRYSIDITTYRKDIEMVNRRPSKVEYITSLEEDLQRRDFTMNALCMDEEGNIIDLLGGIKDIQERKVKCIGEANSKLKEDPLRMLRAIRFAITLDFSLDTNLYNAILKNKKLIKNLSYNRKRAELDKILTSPNAKMGMQLLNNLDILDLLEIEVNNELVYTNDLCGMYSQIKVSDKYVFTKEEQSAIKSIKKILKYGKIDNYIVYTYGLYLSMVAGEILNISKTTVSKIASNLPLKSRNDLALNGEEIILYLNIKPGKIVSKIISILEKEILEGRLVNKRDILIKYLQDNERKLKHEE